MKRADKSGTEDKNIMMTIDDEPVAVAWEENESVTTLRRLLGEQHMSIQMSM